MFSDIITSVCYSVMKAYQPMKPCFKTSLHKLIYCLFQLTHVEMVISHVLIRRNASKQAGCVTVTRTVATEVTKSHSTVTGADGVSSKLLIFVTKVSLYFTVSHPVHVMTLPIFRYTFVIIK